MLGPWSNPGWLDLCLYPRDLTRPRAASAESSGLRWDLPVGAARFHSWFSRGPWGLPYTGSDGLFPCGPPGVLAWMLRL